MISITRLWVDKQSLIGGIYFRKSYLEVKVNISEQVLLHNFRKKLHDSHTSGLVYSNDKKLNYIRKSIKWHSTIPVIFFRKIMVNFQAGFKIV